jgi:hypothetical protein
MNAAYLRVDVKIKFRALGFTYANWSDHYVLALPPFVALISTIVGGTHKLKGYNDHGVQVDLTLQSGPIG